MKKVEKIIRFCGRKMKVTCDGNCNKAWGIQYDCAKPKIEDDQMNRWCIRECERCASSAYDGHNCSLDLPDFSVRVRLHI